MSGIDSSLDRFSGVEVLWPGGGLDVFTAGMMRQLFVVVPDASTTAIVVDMSRVDFVDSAGTGLLVGLASRARQRDAMLALAVASSWVQRHRHGSGFDRVAAIAGSLTDAMEAIRRRP